MFSRDTTGWLWTVLSRYASGMIELDHLVIAARTLQEGHDFVLEKLGVQTRLGGKHARMGTHNRLLGLGCGTYLEVIAVDPDAANSSQRRWFGLDGPKMRESLERGPRLIHWVARTGHLERDVNASLEPLGTIHQMERGNYRWRITIPADGHLPGDGLVPTLIAWDVPQHPSDALPDTGLRLVRLEGTHPEPERIRSALGALNLEGMLEIQDGKVPKLEANVQTPNGTVIL
jgi:Glyoxalase-like domain